jgi:hypothetical protein
VRNKCLAQDAHEACKNQEIRLEAVEISDDGLIEGCTIGKVRMKNAGRLDASSFGSRKTKGFGLIAEYNRDVEVEVAASNSIDKRLQIGTGPGNQNRCFAALCHYT